jgi:hypothetical protein
VASEGGHFVGGFEPAYLSLTPAELQARVAAGLRELEDCLRGFRGSGTTFVTPEHVAPQADTSREGDSH